MAGNWADLRTRVVSGAVLALGGAAAVLLGGVVFDTLVVVLAALMIWEIARMAMPGATATHTALAVTQGICISAALWIASPFAVILAAVAPAALWFGATTLRRSTSLYALATGLAVLVLASARDSGGAAILLWIVLVVAASDTAGYFAGRAFGGPKFWPKVSPKKTWSGTIAGWIGAYLVALAFAALHSTAPPAEIAPLVAFAGQMGDIVESALKRRAGIKDASNLIPGHGGVLDRFDALIGAALLIMCLHLVLGGGLL